MRRGERADEIIRERNLETRHLESAFRAKESISVASRWQLVSRYIRRVSRRVASFISYSITQRRGEEEEEEETYTVTTCLSRGPSEI